MKNLVFSIIAVVASQAAVAQVVSDTVSTGPSYTKQVWYSLSDDEKGSAPKNNWDIAFDVSSFGSTIQINSAAGVQLWNYPSDDIDGWATVDTTGLSSWSPRWNSDTSWALGAMGRYADPANSSDVDWGIYNMTTHVVSGDSLYIIKLGDGSYKKLTIESLAGSVYTFKYANPDGSDPRTGTINKASYAGKNFGYYSLQTHSAADREPATADWDLLFTQYTAFVPGAYTVTGILANKGVKIAKVTGLADKHTFVGWTGPSFSTEINKIGYNWKTFNGTGYNIQDSTVFFVETKNGDIWKVIMTGFGGSATGNYLFSKEKLHTGTTTIADPEGHNAMTMVLYPNPAIGEDVSLLLSGTGMVTISVSDISGWAIISEHIVLGGGLTRYVLPREKFDGGNYVVSVRSGAEVVSKLLVIR